jgi:hypothetical protein
MRRIKNGTALIGIILTGCIVPMEAQQKTAKKRFVPIADFSVLMPFQDALLDLKGAIEAGVNRQDYQRKLQTATGESLKAKARLPDDEDKPGIARHCFNSYGHVLRQYEIARIHWDQMLWMREHKYEHDASELEARLQKSWSDADDALEEALACARAR